jgi:TRAP-type C4-dicarboxylate transport system substrate-binding protein
MKFVLSATTLALALTAGTASGQTNILFGSATTPTSAQNAHGTVPWLEGAGEVTGGQITYDLQAGGAIVTGDTALTSLRDGLVDGAGIIATYYPSDLPLNSLISNLAFLGGDPRATSGAIAELTLLNCEDCLEEFEFWNIVPFGPYATDPYSLACRGPVAELADLRGLRVRVSGSAWSRMADALGMVPTNMPVGEIYEALQRGTVDCTFTGLSLLDTLSLGEVAQHVIDIPVGSLFTPSNLALNRDFWNSLPDEHKQALINSTAFAVASTAYGYLEAAEAVRATAEENGISIEPMTESVSPVVDEFIASERASIIEEGMSMGITDIEEIVAKFEELNEKWEGIVASIPETKEALAEQLDAEIYSNFPSFD